MSSLVYSSRRRTIERAQPTRRTLNVFTPLPHRCHACALSNTQCTYDLSSDKRKPFTRDVVQAMQMRIDSLESELAQMHLAQNSTMPAGEFQAPQTLERRASPTESTR